MENYYISRSLLKTILYFDIFSYPLLAKEAISFCDYPGLNPAEGCKALRELKRIGLLNYYAGYYFVGYDYSIVDRRIEENKRAEMRMKTARRFTKIISSFPYVRAVFISGSLSKRVMKPDSDIDYFIITKPGRLWFCRASLTIFKKIFLGNSHRNFCLNYFVDTDTLSIPDRNRFTATETAFLLPMYNYPLYLTFLRVNNWYRKDYPNIKEHVEVKPINPIRMKGILEATFDNFIGKTLDHLSFKIISGFWKKKYKHLDEKSFSLKFRSLKNVSKYHPNSYQKKVLETLERKVREFEQSRGFSFSDTIPLKITGS